MSAKETKVKEHVSAPAKMEASKPISKDSKSTKPQMKPAKPTAIIASKKEETPKVLTLKEVLNFESQVSSFKSIVVPFQEKMFRQLRKKTLHKEGFAYFVRPNKFIWQVGTKGSKAKQYWIYDGKELIQRSSEDKQEARFDSKVAKSKELNRLVSYFVNFKDLFKTHDLVVATEYKNELGVVLKTKAQTNLHHIKARLSIKEEKNKRLVLLKHMQIFYHDKNHTTFDFTGFSESLPKPSPISQGILNYLK
jgi:hypothetical protein